MTNKEHEAEEKKVLELLKKGWYIKGFGARQSRVMDKDHNPIKNIPNSIRTSLLHDERIEQSGLIYVLKT